MINFNRVHFALKILRTPSQRKYLWKWIKSSLQKDYFLIYRQPWITFDAVDFLDTINLQNKHVFEYGSGGSTLYWLDKGASVISIEHDPVWFNKVKSLISPSYRLDYRLVLPEPESDEVHSKKNPANPDDYISSEDKKVTYKSYVCQIDEFDDKFFDVVLIDGRARPSCIKHSVAKVKSGGVLILDNSDREYYTERTKSLLESFGTKTFCSPLPQCTGTRTSIYIKL